MTALPSTISFTGGSVTEGAFKTALSDQRDFLAGLLGADGTPSTARAAMGVPAAASPLVSGSIVWSDLANLGMGSNIGTGNPGITFDSNDYIDFIRASNAMRFGIGGTIAMQIDANSCIGFSESTPSSFGRIAVSESGGRTAGFFQHSGTANSVNELRATSESYVSSMHTLTAYRSASASYSFLQAYSDSNGTPDLEFNLLGSGSAFADGSFTGSGADYQEYFHSTDGAALLVGECVVLEGDQVRLATDRDTADQIIGVVRPKEDNKNSAVVGNAAWNHWTDKYLTDDYGRYVLETYKVYEWTETIPAVTRPEKVPKTETRSVTRFETVLENGRATLKPVTVTAQEPIYNDHPLFDAKGKPVFTERPVLDANGAPVMTDVAVLDEQKNPVLVDGVPAVQKEVIRQRVQAVHREPVMETVQKVVTPEKTIKHAYADYKMPQGVTPPRDAKVTTLTRRKLNPAFQEGGNYTPRHERPEWNLIGLLGQVQIREGAPVNPRWVKMKAISDTVSLWFIR